MLWVKLCCSADHDLSLSWAFLGIITVMTVIYTLLTQLFKFELGFRRDMSWAYLGYIAGRPCAARQTII
jgi:hypothetical protein